MNSSSSEAFEARSTRWWNITAFIRNVGNNHKRVKPLGVSPGVCDSIIAIFKSSREHHLSLCEISLLTDLYLISFWASVEFFADFHSAFRELHSI